MSCLMNFGQSTFPRTRHGAVLKNYLNSSAKNTFPVLELKSLLKEMEWVWETAGLEFSA